MRLLCALGWHKPSQRIIENEGRVYSRCKRCGTDLIKVGEGWKTAPRGYRVIWKDPSGAEAAEAAPAKRKPRSASKAKAPAKRGRPHTSEPAKAKAPAKEAPPATAKSEEKAEAPARRRRPDRRAAQDKTLPPKLGGKERRRSRNRRQGFGKKPDEEA